MGLGIKLLLIGMTTVFVILLLVIIIGKSLVRITNSIAFDPEVPSGSTGYNISDKHIRTAIEKAVDKISGGTKRIEKIEKL